MSFILNGFVPHLILVTKETWEMNDGKVENDMNFGAMTALSSVASSNHLIFLGISFLAHKNKGFERMMITMVNVSLGCQTRSYKHSSVWYSYLICLRCYLGLGLGKGPNDRNLDELSPRAILALLLCTNTH